MKAASISTTPYYSNSVFVLDADTALWFFLAGLAVATVVSTFIALCITRSRSALLALGFALAIFLQVPELSYGLLHLVHAQAGADQLVIFARIATTIFFVSLMSQCMAHEYRSATIPNTAIGIAIALAAASVVFMPLAVVQSISFYIALLFCIAASFCAVKLFIARPHSIAIINIAFCALLAWLARAWLEAQRDSGALLAAQFSAARAGTFWIEANCILLGLLFISRRHRLAIANKAIALARQAEKIATIAPLVKASRHDLRAPLADIIGLAQLVADQPLDREQRNYVAAISAAARNALNNINTIFSHSKSEENSANHTSALRNEPFKLPTIIEDCSHFYDPYITDSNPDLVVRLAEDIPTVLIGDHETIRQILLLQFEFLLVELGCRQLILDISLQKNSLLVLNFLVPQPEAAGAMLKDLPNAFILSKNLAALCNGNFKVAIERRTAGEQEGLASSTALSVELCVPVKVDKNFHDEYAIDDALRLQRVLIVDDSMPTLSVISAYLQRWGVEVFTARNAAEAKAQLLHQAMLTEAIDICIVDYRLPDSNGLELVADLLNNDRLKQMPAVIIMSNSASLIAPKVARNYGVHSILEKPVLAETLRLTLLENLYMKLAFKGGLDDLLGAPSPGNASEDNLANPPAPKKVLLVEDDAISASVTVGFLRALGLDYEIVKTGARALALVAVNRYDLVLMDCTLPDQTGFEVAQTIRKREQQQTTPNSPAALQIVALTADDSENFRRLSASSGMDEHLLKPITLNNLKILTR